MKRLLFSFVLTAGFTVSLQALEDETPTYTQEYSIILNGAISGTETVTEQVSREGNILASSTNEIFVTDGVDTKRMAFTTSMALQKKTWAPISYACRYSSGETRDSYEVRVRGVQVVRSLTRSGRTSETSIQVQPGFVIVDFNVYHQYDYLFRRYDLQKGGRQTFMNFLPLIASEIPLALTRLEDSTFGTGEKVLQIQNYRVEFGTSWVGIASSDTSGRLVRLLLQDKGLEVIRKDLLPE
jgi:hypothetical protein